MPDLSGFTSNNSIRLQLHSRLSEILGKTMSLSPAPMKLSREQARSPQTTLIHLFELTLPSGEILRITGHGETSIGFGGKSYTVMPVETSGFSWNGRGMPVTPTLEIDNSSAFFTIYANSGGMIGARLVRIVTLQDECDPPLGDGGGSSFTPETWMIERLVRMDRNTVVFELAPGANLDNRLLPQRVMLRDLCQHRYRIWDEQKGRFDYSQATCPYVGSEIFDAEGNTATENMRDECSLRLESGCKKRFTGTLPYLGFPGLGTF